jgi:hypothetical protein
MLRPMSILCPTPRELMVDAQGRPYFLWDSDMTLARFRELLRDPDERVRTYYVGKLMRQAKPDDAFEFVTLADIGASWPQLERYLGRKWAFWTWLLGEWGVLSRSPTARVNDSKLGVATRERHLSNGSETVVVDLVAEPVATVEAPTKVSLGGKQLSIDTRHEILVNKLCTLVERSEARDLVATGGNLARALADAPRKDGGFSPLTLVWLLRGFPVRELAAREGWPAERTARVEAFRDQLIGRLTDQTRPEA